LAGFNFSNRKRDWQEETLFKFKNFFRNNEAKNCFDVFGLSLFKVLRWSNVDVRKIFQKNDFCQILDQQNLQEHLKSSQKLDRMCSYLSGKHLLLQKGRPQDVCVKFLNHLGPPYIDEYSFSKHSIIKLQFNEKI
jgi:hypothetical protein